MKTVKRKAKVGEKIIITDPRKGWNAYDDDLKGAVMIVNRVHSLGVYTNETGIGFYINHEGYEVIGEA